MRSYNIAAYLLIARAVSEKHVEVDMVVDEVNKAACENGIQYPDDDEQHSNVKDQ